ncbi:ATP-binding protein [Sphaerotilus mobilis]|uniref:ATP-binding protein n=1 Tax=Sphaerotilus mobilis TaxID=47994 RepID=UPI001F5E906D|nr:DUF4143 domain-containing protein [Sphaerotilus mobilis]
MLLGSASLDLLAQSGETLAGRIAYLELAPLTVRETGSVPPDRLWLRGGFPDSLEADSDALSLRWRQNFIRTYLERDIPQFGPRIAAAMLQRFWTMLAHHQGGLLNMSQFARNLGVDVKTVQGYINLLENLLLLRRLPPWHANLGKRLVKSPKVYVRDSGLVHALLGIEVKRSLSPKVRRGFHAACDDLQPQRRLVVYPGTERYPLARGVEVIPLASLCAELG